MADRLGQTSDWEAREGGEADPLMDESQVREWLAAGHQIGAHTCTHPRLSQLSDAQANEEISASRKKLEDLLECRLNTSPIPMGTTTRGTSSWSNRLALKQPSPCTEESIPRVHQCLNYDAGPPGIPAEPSKTCFADSFKVLRGTYPRIYLTVVVCASRLRWKI